MKKVIYQVAVLMMTTGYVLAGTAGEKDKPAKTSSRVEVAATPKAAVYKLNYAAEREGAVKVNIYDGQGALMYTDYIRNTKAFNKAYDFSALPSGEYRIEVVGVGDKAQRSIRVGQALGGEQGKLAATVATVDPAGKYALKVQRAQMAPVVVNIYDADNHLIYQDEIDVDRNFSRVYDFSRAFSKAVAFEVYSDGAVVRQTIR